MTKILFEVDFLDTEDEFKVTSAITTIIKDILDSKHAAKVTGVAVGKVIPRK